MKTGKAMGLDGISAEALKAGGETVVECMKIIIDNILKTGDWPHDWTISEIVTMPKVVDTQECNKHRTLILISHGSKILLDIIRQSIAHYVNPEIAEHQFGFISGKGTTDAMLVLRNLTEKSDRKSKDQELWLMFIDYAKAFDTVTHRALWGTVIDFGVPKHLVWPIRQLYLKSLGVVRIPDGNTESFPFEKGVRKGCLLSPMLFNAVGEKIMRLVAAESSEDVDCNIGGENTWYIRYADDTTMLAKDKDKLEHLAVSVEEHSKNFGLMINRAKTNVMTVHGESVVKIAETDLEVVDKFKYLGLVITPTEPSACEIRTRLGHAKSATSKLDIVWRSSNLSLSLEKRLGKALVWSVGLYGCESWTLRQRDEDMSAAIGMLGLAENSAYQLA